MVIGSVTWLVLSSEVLDRAALGGLEGSLHSICPLDAFWSWGSSLLGSWGIKVTVNEVLRKSFKFTKGVEPV